MANQNISIAHFSFYSAAVFDLVPDRSIHAGERAFHGRWRRFYRRRSTDRAELPFAAGSRASSPTPSRRCPVTGHQIHSFPSQNRKPLGVDIVAVKAPRNWWNDTAVSVQASSLRGPGSAIDGPTIQRRCAFALKNVVDKPINYRDGLGSQSGGGLGVPEPPENQKPSKACGPSDSCSPPISSRGSWREERI